MNFSDDNMLNYQVILSSVLDNVDDREFKKFHKGTYVGLIQESLEQLSQQTYFLKVEKDIVIPATLTYHIESGCFNLREIKIYNGDCCDKGNGRNLWWKKDFRTTNGTYVDAEKIPDPFIQGFTSTSHVYWYGIENNTIYLSPNCSGYTKLNMIFNGSITVMGDTPTIPIQLRKAVTDYVTTEIFKKLKAKNPKLYRPLWSDAKMELEDRSTGSWTQAKMWCSQLDTKSRNDLMEYLSRANS